MLGNTPPSLHWSIRSVTDRTSVGWEKRNVASFAVEVGVLRKPGAIARLRTESVRTRASGTAMLMEVSMVTL